MNMKKINQARAKMTEEAKSRAVNSVAAISDEEVKDMVLKYYEIDEIKPQSADVVDILDTFLKYMR